VTRAFAAAMLLLMTDCGGPAEDQTSESAIGNAAVGLERKAEANVNRAVAEIEAQSAAEAPLPVTKEGNSNVDPKNPK
jgi:hypothetical protein